MVDQAAMGNRLRIDPEPKLTSQQDRPKAIAFLQPRIQPAGVECAT